MPAQPDDAVVAILAAAGLGLTGGTNLFGGPVRPQGSGVPLASVFALSTGGPVHQPYIGNAHDLTIATVQVNVRGAPGDFAGGETLARACLVAIHRAAIAGYAGCIVREPRPTYLGADAGTDTHLWSLNVELTLVE